jgi:glycosyltransferase involved in cell wall biosynthesis
LRLAVVTPFVDRQHGTERALAELLDRLSREYGCEIHLYAERVADLECGASAPPSRSSTRETGTTSTASSGSITWHRVPSIPGPHLIRFLFWILANTTMRWWHRVARGQRVDLVLSPGINCLDADFVIVHALFRRLRELSNEPSAQNKASETQSVSWLRRLHRGAYYATVAALERIVYANRKTRLAAVSRRTAGLLGRYFNRTDVAVIYNGIDTVQFSVPARLARRQGARFRSNFSDKELVLLLIGNDWRVKGLPTILAAMAATRDLPLRLVVVGSDVAASFQHSAQQLGIADRCRWASPNADVIDFYAIADVYVSPSREDSFGLPVAEAMACGLPVITSKFAGVSELIQNERDGLILPDPTSAPVLSDLLRGLYANPAARTTLGAAAAVTAQSFTWDRAASETWQWLQPTKLSR